MKDNVARSKIVSIVTTTLISGLLVSIPASIPAQANTPACVPVSTNAGGDTVLTFNDIGDCEWTVPAGISAVRVLVVGGGGSASAGLSNIYWPAGGGGGAVVANSSISVTAGNKVTITVGAGGAATAATSGAVGNNGGSSAFGSTTASGGSTNSNVATSNAGRLGGTSGNGNLGGTGTSSGSSCTSGSCGTGGGGGAGGAGGVVTGVTDARNGGLGVNSDISGSTVGYGGGGAGANGSSGSASHGGAIGYFQSTSSSATGNGVANTGGGGARATSGYGGAGGSGVVIVRYTTPSVCDPTSTIVGSNTVLTFSDSGSCVWTVPAGVTSARVLVVGGGSSGGAGQAAVWWPQGGGGGGVVDNSNFSISSSSIAVTVGAGGAAINTQGAASTSVNNGGQSRFATITANGGTAPNNTLAPGGTSGNGNLGGNSVGQYASGGGGGAGGAGNGTTGGVGVNSNISGATVMYGSGGAGSSTNTGSVSSGGGSNDNPPAANRGGGGSQPTGSSGLASAGAAGVVIVSFTQTVVSEPIEVPANCRAGVGIGGVAGTTANQAGHGCVLIKYSLSSKTYYQSFNYTGANQSWTSPSDVTSLTFYLLGAGGGAMNVANRGPGGSGGFATGTYAVSAATTFTIIVGQGGNGTTQSLDTYGGGGKADYGSGGGRSAIRLASATEDLITAGGGGGGGYDAKCGGAGGGTTGQDAVIRTSNGEHGKGGTQTTGGAGGYSVNTGRAGVAGVKYQGGLGRDESGGGGGGYWGGGGGGDNIGAGGGSGYFNPTLITNRSLVQGTCTIPGNSSSLRFTVSYNGNNNTSGTAPTDSAVNAFTSTTLATNSGVLARDRFTFGGWNTRANGAGTTYTVGQTNFSPPGDLTLYALWNSTITYNTNGATGTVPTAVTTTTDASRTFQLNSGSGLTKTGLSLAGWNTAADGSGTNYLGSASYTSTGSATLFAIFRPLYTYNANGATSGTVPASTFGPVPGTQCTTDPGFNNCRVFSYTGSDQQFTVPSDIDTSKGVLVEAWGAGGGGSVAYYGDPGGGAGGYSKATLTTPTTGEVLRIVVGQGGLVRDQTVQYGGGGPGGEGGQVGSSGGGYSGVFTGTTPLLISGAGGGASPGSATNGTPGGGGGANQNGGQAGTAAVAGRGGTSSAGGAGATGNTSCPTTGSLSRNGSYLQGGASCNQANAEGGGGGGGGYYGGGGGTYQTAGGGPENGGGGGGSGYLDLTRGTLITAVVGGNGVVTNFSYPDITSVNYADNAGRGGKSYTNTVSENSGGNGLITIQWSSTTVSNPVANNTGNLARYGYSFVGWNTAADGSGTKVPAGSAFPATASATLFAEWVPSSTGLTPNFKTNTSTPIAVLKSTTYTINNEYTGTDNDLIVSQYADKIQIIASVPTGTLAITTTTNLTLPIGYQSALNTAASTISFVGNLADVNAALATLRYAVPATAVITTITITASYAGIDGNYRYNPATGSSYLRDATTATRTTVLNRTTASNNCGITFNGMCGYMTIPNNADESLFIFQKLGQGWIGLSKPNHPTLQYVANAPAGLPTTPFTFWSAGEGGASTEPNIAIWNYGDGKWVDQGPLGVQGALYEFGGKSENPIFAALSRTIAIAPAVTITYLANGSTTGTVPSPFTSVAGNTIKAAANSGNLVKTGLTFAGWNTKADGTGTTYLANSEFTTPTSISLHAMYLAACTPTRTKSGGFVVLTFTGAGNCLWTTPAGVTSIDLLAVGGGGGGGSSLGGGGGGGQVISQTGVASIGTAVISVASGGAGGAGSYGDAQNHGKTGGRSGYITPTVSTTVLGGSGGNGRYSATNLNPDGTAINTGYTGGGGAYPNSGSDVAIAGTGGNNFIGGNGAGTGGGGGGGAGGPGIARGATSNASSGGIGVSNSITGTATYYGGGGGASWYSSSTSWTGVGGLGGGGKGAAGTGAGTSGTANTGGGGGGGYDGLTGGTGGTGIVILRYAFGTPSAPVITSITGSANKLSVAFTAPASDGGSAISNYEYSLDGGATWTTISPVDATSPIEITKLANGTTNLTNGNTYQVAIRALNGKTGLASNVVAGTTPLSPPIISAVAGNAQATITVGPAVGESPTSYTVTALDNSGVALNPAKTCTVTAPATSCVITGLTNGTPYKFSAVANLGSQTSTATTTSTGITPAAPIVTYNANNGTVGPSNTASLDIAFKAGTPVVHPLPVRAGFNFTGWFNASNTLIGQNGSNYEPAATITLTAGWAGVTYSISYNGNGHTGGSVPATGAYVNGSSTPYSIVGNTGVLVKTGYTFVEWVDGTGTARSGNYSTGADLQLFAKWNPVTFQVSYNANGGSGTPTTQSYEYGTAGITLNSGSGTTRDNYVFLGWSVTPTGTTVSSPYIPTANTTLYARWAGATYSVSFNSNGGSLSPASMSYTTGGATLTLPSAGTQAGYEFAGWSDTLNGNLVSNPYTATTNLTLYAKWTATQYTIAYNRGVIGSTTLASGQPVVFPTNTTSTISTVITLDSTIDSSTVLSGTTYVFTGWKESGTNSAYKGGDSYRMPAANVTFTAQWVAVYTVSYILNGGSGAVPADVTQTDGSSSTLTAIVPTRAGFTFAGWKDQAGASVSGSTFTVGPTRYLLYAQWTPDVYTITYVPGANVTGTVTATTGGYKESVTLGSDSTLSYTNFKFVGWKIGTTIYSADGNYVLTGNVNAEAQWESTLSQIFYDINGGTGTAAPTVATQGQPVTLLSTGTFSRTGYALAGWIGGGQTTPVTTFTNSTTNSVTLIAKWTLLAPGIPAAPTAVAGSGSATVTVNPSTSGGQADSFLITASNGSTCRVDAPSTSCVITGLTDGLSYTFTSTATNSAGSATASVASNSVTPAGKPSIVTGVSATAGNGNAAVRFTAPATTGGAPIASYTVTASTGQTCIITPTFPDPLGCTVSGLTNGTPVTFAVQANNGAYTSDSSTATIAVTPATISAAPTAVTATSTTPGKATVTFTAPTDNGGSAIIEYIVTSSPGGLTCVTTNPTNGCEISGLTNGVPYTFTVIAKNGVDNSLPSLASTAVTPVGKPSTPTNVIASPSNASATISFTAPNTGGSPITRYDVEAFDESGVAISPALTCTLNLPFPTPLACKFDGTLTNGLSYTFKVSATNVIGTSDTSTATAAVTPANLIRPTADLILKPTGDSIVGEVLTSSVQFGGFPIPSVTYVWERCTTSAATSCTTISGAIADTYTTTPADVGFYIRYRATGTNTSGTAVGTSVTTNKITDNPVLSAPTSGLSGTTGTAFSLSPTVTGGADPFTFTIRSGTLPAGLTLDSITGTISGTPTTAGSEAITLLVTDAKSKTASTSFTISITVATSNIVPEPDPEPACNVFCQAALAKAAADKVAADAAAKATVDKATADAAAKVKADTDATSASTKAMADAVAAAAAAKAAVDKAAAAAVAQAAADAAAKTAAAAAKTAADAQAAAIKAAADAAAALKSSTTTAAAKAAATKSANTAAAAATTAVKAAVAAATAAAKAKSTAANTSKQVDIAINSLTSKTAASQSSAQANAIAAAAKAAANAAAQAAADAATTAKKNATEAQKAASDAALRIATEQKQAADAAALAKIAADAAVKATTDKIAADAVVTKTAQELANVLAEKAALAEQAAKETSETARAEIQKKIEEVTKKVDVAQKASETATANAEAAARVQTAANQSAEAATKEAQIRAAVAVAAKAESVAKTAAATKAVTAATIATKVAAAAKAAAAKVPAKAAVATKPSTSTKKNSAIATVTGLKPGQKVKVTVNVKPKPKP